MGDGGSAGCGILVFSSNAVTQNDAARWMAHGGNKQEPEPEIGEDRGYLARYRIRPEGCDDGAEDEVGGNLPVEKVAVGNGCHAIKLSAACACLCLCFAVKKLRFSVLIISGQISSRYWARSVRLSSSHETRAI
jgi:hypothetical protein